MKHRNESGFSVVEILVVVFLAALLILAGVWTYSRIRTASKLRNVTSHESVDEAKPTLQNLGGVYLAAYDKATGLAGDMRFDTRLVDPTDGGESMSYLFGQKIVQKGKPDRTNSSLDFRGIYRQIDVLAAIDGKVLSVKTDQGSGEYEVVLAGSDDSSWQIAYEHLVDLKVERGGSVVAGQAIGKAAPYRIGTYYYAISASRKTAPLGDVIEYVCPTELLNKDVRPAYAEGVNLFIRDWITYRTKDAYGPQDGGCIKPTVKAQEIGE